MRSPRLFYLAAVLVYDLALLPATVAAANCQNTGPLWLEPSPIWLGIDGKWSHFSVGVGSTPPKHVYLTPATALSEIWVVQPSGCSPVQLCYQQRGEVFDPSTSAQWAALGPYELGEKHTGMKGHGDYGLDSVFFNDRTIGNTRINKALIAAINDTNYYTGFIGLGPTPGKFGNTSILPLISQLASVHGTIPSHSFGYTAGAHHRNIPASLTFGGYDTTRFVPHDTTFALHARTRMPTVRLRGVSADVTSLDKAPTKWSSTSQTFVAMNDSITAVIDNTTPYLWLPTEVCERFAEALNLKWNETLGVYVYADGPQYTRFLTEDFLSFTFSLSSYDNSDDFGFPLNVKGVVNITLPSAAFAHVLNYPFKDAIGFGESGIPYFPLKRSTEEENGNQYIIGRAFMQEAYMIARYDSATFSIHQARFPKDFDTIRDRKVEEVPRPANSPYDEYTGPKCEAGGGISVSKTVGIVLSAFAAGSVIGFVLWFVCWRKRGKKSVGPMVEEDKEDTRSIDGLPKSPVKRMFSRIVGRKPSKRPVTGTTEEGVRSAEDGPAEVGAGEDHQVFEMPVPIAPVELDSHDIGDDDTDMGGDGSHGLSEYEITRRKLERQLQGPVPTYSATVAEPMKLTNEKSAQDVSVIGHYRPTDHRPVDDPSPVSSPTDGDGSLPIDAPLPSPLSPHPNWGTRMFDFPSPMTIAQPAHLAPISVGNGSSGSGGSNYSPVSPHSPYSPQTYVPSSISRSNSNGVSPTSPVGSMRFPPTPTVQRTPIDPSRVVCLGPLPENVQLPNQQPSLASLRSRSTPQQPSLASMRSTHQPSLMSMRSIPQIVAPDRPAEHVAPHPENMTREDLIALRRSRGSNDSLGSNFTVDEENRLRGEGEDAPRPPRIEAPPPLPQPPQSDDFPRSPRSMERIETGCELVHVPQVAEKRYSWEEK